MDVLGDGISEVEFIDAAGSDLSVVRAARVSYNNDTDVFDDIKDTKLIKYLMRNNHGSPLEHNMITFRIKAPLFVIQEMLRHRIGVNFNQQSGRYTAFVPEFYIPLVWRRQDAKNKQSSNGSLDLEIQEELSFRARQVCDLAYATYEKMLEMGAPREQASRYLPHATYSNMYITFNLRSLLHFLELRLSPLAQWEIQKYAQAFLSVAEDHFPVTIQAWKELREENRG